MIKFHSRPNTRTLPSFRLRTPHMAILSMAQQGSFFLVRKLEAMRPAPNHVPLQTPTSAYSGACR